MACSGDVITGHWYWDAVVFDRASTSAPAKLSILVEHDRARRAAYEAQRASALALATKVGAPGVLEVVRLSPPFFQRINAWCRLSDSNG